MLSGIKNVRARLTLWYVLIFTFILILYAGFTIALLYLNLRHNLDQELAENYELLENIIQIGANDSLYFKAESNPYLRENWFEIWSPENLVLFKSRPVSSAILPSFQNRLKNGDGFRFKSLSLPNDLHLRIMQGKVNIDGHWFFVRLIKNEASLWRELFSFLWILIIALPLSIIIAGWGGYFLSKKLLAPVDRMAVTARKIGEENLHERLPVANARDELGNLSLTFNALLDRLEKSFLRLKQFTSDAAHELRTPLTAIRSMGEVSLQENKKPEYYRNVIGSILEENRRLTRLIDSLLFLSRADSDQMKLRKELFDFIPFVEQTIEFIQPLAEEKKQVIELQSNGDISLFADRDLVREALLNILDNAIKYAPAESKITVTLKHNAFEAAISISDSGNGIPKAHLDKIFRRFYRVDKARSRELGGSGLGLAISLWVIQMHNGTIAVKSKQNEGSRFTISLPIKNDNARED